MAVRILLVDDDREDMVQVAEALRLKRNTVVHARNLPEVALAAQEGGFDCIILDIMVPPTRGIPASRTNGGYTAGAFLYAEVIKVRMPETPFVILTAADDSVDAVRDTLARLEVEPAFRANLKKPITIANLVFKLERAVAPDRDH